ncbi:MAG TPA: hypothetical protein VMW24_22940 [Sedimentisphaerales bacterium]|nr:hypothetical protein [Sedimentisphaerales bacterium]
MKASEELSVITKAYDLILWFVPIIGRFPTVGSKDVYDFVAPLQRPGPVRTTQS